MLGARPWNPTVVAAFGTAAVAVVLPLVATLAEVGFAKPPCCEPAEKGVLDRFVAARGVVDQSKALAQSGSNREQHQGDRLVVPCDQLSVAGHVQRSEAGHAPHSVASHVQQPTSDHAHCERDPDH
jgi:hypothetical protein